jgi:hypothetical protein
MQSQLSDGLLIRRSKVNRGEEFSNVCDRGGTGHRCGFNIVSFDRLEEELDWLEMAGSQNER